MKHNTHTAHTSSKISSVVLGWLLALLPAAAFALLLAHVPLLLKGNVLANSFSWLPSLGVQFSYYLDGLSALFALLVSGIGACVLVYAGYYFDDEPKAEGNAVSWFPPSARFFVYLLLFMASMMGLVLAGNVITLFVFWEGTSITSFLLVAYKSKDEAARTGAFRALFITGGGGIALLAGLLFASHIAGSSDIATLLKSGDVLRSHALYPVAVGLVAVGAFTKSAQFPAHFWLPGAMSAPTPASAYLHSATMVKAGIYLMARLHPALGGTDLWFWLLSSTGLLTALVGAFYGLRQNDLKGLLAYSTISQLGVLMFLIGQPHAAAFKALVVGIVAHALYKGCLFLVAGVVDHAAHTRDLRHLANLRLANAMPITLIIASFAALSMAGLPPLFGFLAKETLLASTLESETPIASIIFTGGMVVVGALLLAQAGIFIFGTFFGQKPETQNHAQHEAHDPALGMLVAPMLLAALSLLLAFEAYLPLLSLEKFIALAAQSAFGEKVKVNLALFQGFNLPLLMSALAIAIGLVIFALRGRWAHRDNFAREPALSVNKIYGAVLQGLAHLAQLATRLQSGSLRSYLAIMLAALGLGVFALGRLPVGALTRFTFDEFSILRAFSLLLVVGASAASVVLKRDLMAILALGASGLAMALLIALEPSPDVALVQIVVDILTTALLLFALIKLPKDAKWHPNDEVKHKAPTSGFDVRDAVIATVAGIVMASICLFALSARPRESLVTPYYEQQSKPLTGSGDIVGAIVVDFRGFDTMIEITVFGMAGLAVFSLLQFAAKKHEVIKGLGDEAKTISSSPRLLTSPSPMLTLLANLTLPVALVLGATHMIYGHDQPGDGFTAGVIISLAIGFIYLVFGHDEAQRKLPWVKSLYLIGAGILTVMAGSVAPALLRLQQEPGSVFFSPVDFGALLRLPLPYGFFVSTSWLFEIAICLTVVGSASLMLNTFTKTSD